MSVQKSALTIQTKQAAPRKVSLDLDPYAAPAEYYGKSHGPRKVAKSRTYSAVSSPQSPKTPHTPYDPQPYSKRHSSPSRVLTEDAEQHDPMNDSKGDYSAPRRRQSHDAQGNAPRRYLIDVDETLKMLLAREDTDHNIQITIEDSGPKTIPLGTAASGGYKHFDVRGTYMLSNLLQELTLAKKYGRKQIVLDEARLNENPVNRLARLVNDQFWPNLRRCIDGSNIFQVARDPKDWTNDPRPRIYVPVGAPEQYEYYKRIAEEHPDMRLDVQWLSATPSNDEYVRDLNEAPGLLAIEMERIEDTPDGKPNFRGLPFVVPGGRFNELYGWDSYMETIGLLVNGRVDLCESMVRHFCFCIHHYGKILNANRTYYLCRSQPPFLTDMALRTYQRISYRSDSLEFLRTAILAAIKDYYTTWMSKPRYDEASGLSRYVPGGVGVPPETESTHFEPLLRPYAEKHKMTLQEFVKAYNYGHVFEPVLDEYFLHDRSVRESGHDTSYRLEKVSANLATVDLNSLLYKYEADIARTIQSSFNGKLEIPGEWHVEGKPKVETSSTWDRRAKKRRQIMEKLMWDDHKGMFFDYNTVRKEQTGYESATMFWAMWAGVVTPEQAASMVKKALPRFEEYGGLASGTEESRGPISLSRPNRQWDYPFGWAPQQILAWTGLWRYGYEADAQRLAYRWLHMVTKAFVDFNGIVVEKYNVTRKKDESEKHWHPHKVTAEYGNQGADFKGVATEGFGWVNASYVYGLTIVNEHMKRALGALTDWDTFKKVTEAAGAKEAMKIFDEAQKHDKVAANFVPVSHSLPHSHEDSAAHKATHGTDKREGHKGPDVAHL